MKHKDEIILTYHSLASVSGDFTNVNLKDDIKNKKNLATVLTSEDVYNILKGITEIAELILDSLNSILVYDPKCVKN